MAGAQGLLAPSGAGSTAALHNFWLRARDNKFGVLGGTKTEHIYAVITHARTTERDPKESIRPVERGTRSTPKGPECGCPDKT